LVFLIQDDEFNENPPLIKVAISNLPSSFMLLKQKRHLKNSLNQQKSGLACSKVPFTVAETDKVTSCTGTFDFYLAIIINLLIFHF